ncbi:MAG: aminotransferase, partial [Desulfuromusa sp.]|nr:aminotransferase [Desulfuromusa sp.]
MRNNIVHIGADELTYEIRAIVKIAEEMSRFGLKTNMENIGDPVAKGEEIPLWIKEIVSGLAMKDCSYGYCATKGLLE